MSSNDTRLTGIVPARLSVVPLVLVSWAVMSACATPVSPAPAAPTSTSISTSSPSPSPSLPRKLRVLLTGDSVSVHLKETLATVAHRRGWWVMSAAVRACSIYGDPLAWADGTPHGRLRTCPRLVLEAQRSMVDRADPDVVIWWDRLSTLPFFRNGEFVRGGSRRFWELRAVAFEKTWARLTAGGARIVFVSTEPIGIGVLQICAGWETRGCREWRRFRMRHYADISQPMNRIMRRYAADHPDEAVFVSITDTICRLDVSPCDDRMGNGKLARPDGTHYRERGALRAAGAIVREMAVALYG
jgi:SGNH domain (fused to AT3 domains)